MELPSPKILIVDDEPDLLEITAAYLEMEGYTPLTAISGAAALELIKTTTPDMILSDITMPGMTGFDLFEKIRSNLALQNTPFVFLSGHTDLQHVMAGKELGSDDYLMKPYEPEMLISTIKGKLKRRQQLNDSMSLQMETLKNQLVRLVSHEMKTPLTSILGVTEILTQGRENLSPEDFTGFLEMLKTGTVRLNKMVEDFLLVVRIDTGELNKEIDGREACIAPLEVLERFVAAHEEIRKRKNLTVELSVADESPYLLIQPTHFENIVSRLLDNACNFVNMGGIVRVTSRYEEARYILSIEDNGNGIPREKQKDLFQKFYQVNRESQEQQGAGLGLYIARKLAELNQCELGFESEEGKGSTFYLSIPKKGGSVVG
jgi:two-component system sensor histidine kinase/response regulator